MTVTERSKTAASRIRVPGPGGGIAIFVELTAEPARTRIGRIFRKFRYSNDRHEG